MGALRLARQTEVQNPEGPWANLDGPWSLDVLWPSLVRAPRTSCLSLSLGFHF